MKTPHATGTVCVLLLLTSAAIAADRTLEEFKKYASQRAPGFSAAQLDALAKGVDKNGDGRISDAEFAQRMSVFRRIATSSPRPPADTPNGESRKATRKVGEIPTIVETDAYPILLITDADLVQAWKPYAVWKTKTGRATKITTVGQIAQKYQADSIQEQIRLCVRDHIEHHGTKWVVLGGDCESGDAGLVPGGHTTVHSQEPQGIPTDIVYLSPTGWDADGDGLFGEWKDDRDAISYPDGSVGLGRIPVRTAADVAAFTEKVIAYESRYPETDFARQMIYTCTDRPAYPKVRKSWDAYVSKTWDGHVGRFFSQETPWDDGKPGSYQLSAENLVGLINKRTTGKLHIHGHGHLPAWVLENSTFTGQHVTHLKNDGAYPLITTVSCNTGEYDSGSDPSIVEAMIRRPKGGSVAIVAPIRTGKAHFHKQSDFRLMVQEGKLDGTTQTMTRYWCHGLGEGLTTGHALMTAKADMAADAQETANYHLCICELNLLGDPTLDMRASVPETPSVDVPESVGVGTSTIRVKTNAPGCRVCAWKDGEVYVVADADENGQATLKIAPKTAGELMVTVSGPSLNVASKTAMVTAAAD